MPQGKDNTGGEQHWREQNVVRGIRKPTCEVSGHEWLLFGGSQLLRVLHPSGLANLQANGVKGTPLAPPAFKSPNSKRQ